jgi:hypothetical protein
MAVLTDKNGRQLGVRSRHLVGRSRSMHTVIDTLEVSAQHAVIAWTGHGWTVRDLGSRNGTTLGGERLEAGRDVPLSVGDVLVFGAGAETLTLQSDEPPGPFATTDDAVALGEGDVLPLPSEDDPVVLVEFDAQRGWLAVTDGEGVPIDDGGTLDIAGVTWTVTLPEAIVATADLQAVRATLMSIGLDFGVSTDEEYVEVTVRLPDGPVSLTPRAHHYPLLVLARAMLEDAEAGVSPAERGWVYVSDLQKMLRMSSNRINLAHYRARRELEALGLADAQDLVQRRRTTQQVRLGVVDVTVSRL